MSEAFIAPGGAGFKTAADFVAAILDGKNIRGLAMVVFHDEGEVQASHYKMSAMELAFAVHLLSSHIQLPPPPPWAAEAPSVVGIKQ